MKRKGEAERREGDKVTERWGKTDIEEWEKGKRDVRGYKSVGQLVSTYLVKGGGDRETQGTHSCPLFVVKKFSSP